ncbi:MAG TPA: DUF475 domain-containing protein [Candidatus Pacearchaeota archaeon]|nr:DUF475 domain-containing protein [Candidatus Pacearchaeota archaeon]
MWFDVFVIILGLCVFEIITSVDNAIINAHVLKTMSQKYRRIFLFWGILFAVFVVRGVLPFIIVWLANPTLNLGEIIILAFSQSPQIAEYASQSKAILLVGGGTYLFLIFFSWIFLEEKKYAFSLEKFIHKQFVWFYAFSSLFLTVIVYLCLKYNSTLAFSAIIGATAFFITDSFKKNAEEKGKSLSNEKISGWSKIFYLEVLDMSFSIDGVIGAFAFTTSVLLIIIGNGLGAFVVRKLTIKGIDKISKYAYLKNGAMYSIGVLGLIMILESFGQEIPFWFSPLNMFLILAIFLFLSYREIKKKEK